jgi:hypothetical protein
MRASCQSDYETIKVSEHLPPEIVNGPVVFIGHNEIKCFNWNFRIVNNAR